MDKMNFLDGILIANKVVEDGKKKSYLIMFKVDFDKNMWLNTLEILGQGDG